MSTSNEKPAVTASETYGVNELKAFRDIGEHFTHLGVDLIVIGHYTSSFGSNPHDLEIYYSPRLKCEYVDKNGVLREVAFGLSKLPALIAENTQAESEALI